MLAFMKSFNQIKKIPSIFFDSIKLHFVKKTEPTQL